MSTIMRDAAISFPLLGGRAFNPPASFTLFGHTFYWYGVIIALGFLLAVMGIQLRFPENSNFVTWMVPVFLLGLPIFDMTLVVVSRLRRGLSPNTAGRDHTSHRLVRLGFSSREAVLILYLFSGILGMMALYITQASLVEGYLVGGIAAILALGALVWLERKWKESEAT